MSNSAGNTGRDIRKFLRKVGIKPTASNVERAQREVSQTRQQYERTQQQCKEAANAGLIPHTVDEDGDIRKEVGEFVLRKANNRKRENDG